MNLVQLLPRDGLAVRNKLRLLQMHCSSGLPGERHRHGQVLSIAWALSAHETGKPGSVTPHPCRYPATGTTAWQPSC